MTSELDERQLIAGLRAESQTEAEDLVQESFLALWRQAERLDPELGLRSYLLSIVHNRCVDQIRWRTRRPESELDLAATFAAANVDTESETIALLEGEAVRAAMQALAPDQRTTVELVYFGGFTINETANRMRVPLGTAKSRLRLAMARLRQELGTP